MLESFAIIVTAITLITITHYSYMNILRELLRNSMTRILAVQAKLLIEEDCYRKVVTVTINTHINTHKHTYTHTHMQMHIYVYLFYIVYVIVVTLYKYLMVFEMLCYVLVVILVLICMTC